MPIFGHASADALLFHPPPWRAMVPMTLDQPETQAILSFLSRVGIEVVLEPVAEDSFLPAMTVRRGN